MPRRVRWVRLTARHLTLAAFAMLLVSVGCGKSLSNVKTNAASSNAPVIVETDPMFAVPNGSPEQILAFVKELRSRRPKLSSEAEKDAYVKKAEAALIQAADKILAQDADDQSLIEAVVMKISITINSAMDPRLTADEVAAAAKNSQSIVDLYRKEKRKAVADTAHSFLIASRVPSVSSMTTVERKELADEAVQLVDARPSQIAIGTVDFLADQFLKTGETDLAVSLSNRMADTLEKSSSEEFKSYSRGFRMKANQVSLNVVGAKFEIEGKLLTGEDFDWQPYLGKVVLVDFWATWCGPCVADLPNVVASYSEYHERGFEVIGVSLDRERKKLESFLEAKPLPWAQVFSDSDRNSSGSGKELAEKYGVSSIPKAYLLDREGKIVSTNARGPELQSLLKKMFE